MSEPDSIVIFRRTLGAGERAVLERFARRLRREVVRGRNFQCLIGGDRDLRRLNRRFLGKDRPTDVLSFPRAEIPTGSRRDMRFLGDVAISAERAARQARRLGHSLREELCILMLHGLLHLAGMDHSRDEGQMARAEARWRKRLGLPAALTERLRK